MADASQSGWCGMVVLVVLGLCFLSVCGYGIYFLATIIPIIVSSIGVKFVFE